MRPEHIEANKLLDIFETGDRKAAKQALEELRGRGDERLYQRAVYFANWQYQLYQRYYRILGWRADWQEQRNRERREQYGQSTTERRPEGST